MTAKKCGLLFGLAAMALLGPMFLRAQGLYQIGVVPTSRSEGRDPVFFATTCTASGWTLVVSSNPIVRSTLIEAPATNTQTVCLSSGPTNANACLPGTPSDELVVGAIFTGYNKSAIYCRSVSGSQILKGHWNQDRGDYGLLGKP